MDNPASFESFQASDPPARAAPVAEARPPVVLAVTDLSERSHDALRSADAHARARGGTLVVCYVRSPLRDAFARSSADLAGVLVDHASAVTGRAPTGLLAEVVVGWHARTIVARARAHGAELIVIHDPDRGRASARLVRRVVRDAPCAVLVARPPHGMQLLVATDLRADALAVVASATREALQLDSPVTVLHCVERDVTARPGASPWTRSSGVLRALTRLASLARRSRLSAELSVIVGAPVDTIVNAAHGIGADLVVTATHRRTGWRRLVHRCVAQAVVRRAPCSVLVLRAPATH